MRPLVPEYVASLKPYVPGKPIEETEREYGIKGVVKLASNENALGASPLAVAAIAAAVKDAHYYPDGSHFHLVRAIAGHLGVHHEEVVAGSGSNEIIELIIRTFMTQQDEALLCRGSFVMYKVALQAHGRPFVEVPMREGFRYDLDAMAKAITKKTRVIFLANPDNPTGTVFGRAELEKFLAKVPPDVFVVLDEAYFEFVDWADYPNGLDYFRKMPNVMVLRTYSKIYGLGGIRLGYGVMQKELAGYLNRTRMPFNVTSLAQAAGVAALKDTEHVRKTREFTQKGVRYMEAELRKLGVNVPTSYANFVFADFAKPAQPIYEQLLRRGLITRPIPNYGFPNALRISVGLQPQNERLVAAVKEVLA